MARRGFQTVVVYLDDFLVTGKSKEECQEAFSVLLKLLQDLGFQISWRKVIGPTQKLVFLGVELDTHRCEMALPRNKLAELHQVYLPVPHQAQGQQKTTPATCWQA